MRFHGKNIELIQRSGLSVLGITGGTVVAPAGGPQLLARMLSRNLRLSPRCRCRLWTLRR